MTALSATSFHSRPGRYLGQRSDQHSATGTPWTVSGNHLVGDPRRLRHRLGHRHLDRLSEPAARVLDRGLGAGGHPRLWRPARRHAPQRSIIENNINQTLGRVPSTARRPGMMFSVPAIFILGYTDFNKPLLVLGCIAGGILGIAFVIPLRKQMIDLEPARLSRRHRDRRDSSCRRARASARRGCWRACALSSARALHLGEHS